VFAGSHVAHVAEVSVEKSGAVRNASRDVRSMVIGEITIKDGTVERDNFDGYHRSFASVTRPI
jgi:hypothetical protein